jgi:hypothetical protein
VLTTRGLPEQVTMRLSKFRVIDTVLKVNSDGSQTVVARLPAVVTYRVQWRDPTLPATRTAGMTEPAIPLIPESSNGQPVAQQPFAGQMFRTGATANVTATTLTHDRRFARTFTTHVAAPVFAEVGFESIGVFAPLS